MRHILFYLGKLGVWFQPNIFFSKGELTENFNDDLDQRIHTYLIGDSKSETNSFTLPISITGNFYDFSGLIFAHHVRLTRGINCCDATIVFYGILELEQLLRLTPLSRILLTENVLYVNMAKYSFDDIKKSLESYLPKQFNIKRFLDQIQINHPTNYDTHHSIDNEFSLMQWSKYIGCYDSIPQQFKKEIDSKLYFKYLKVQYPVLDIDPSQISILAAANTRVLLIDDEAIKGWAIFYKSFFNNSDVEFIDSGIDFKNIDGDKIVLEVELKVDEFKPDVVLLDLRLHDSDFEDNIESDNLTGILILEKIKKINSGIQVIITTASNKAWNFNLAKQKGAYDFIIKNGFESPEKVTVKLSEAVTITSKRALFLKDIGGKILDLKKLILNNSYLDDKNDELKNEQEKKDIYREKLFSNLDLAFELLDLSHEIPGKQKYFAYCYLQLFICIEEFLAIKEVFEYGEKCYVDKNILVAQKDLANSKWTSSIKFIEKNPSYYTLEEDNHNQKLNPQQTDFKMSSVLIYLFNQNNSNSKNWPKLRDVRNQKAAHPEKGNIYSHEIIQLLDFLHFIFDNGSLTKSKKKGLFDEISKNDLSSLKNRFNSK